MFYLKSPILAVAGILCLILNGSAIAQLPQTRACGLTTVGTGGTAVNAITGPVNGFFIVNPLSASDEGVTPVEPLYIDPVTTATTSANQTNSALAAGQPYYGGPNGNPNFKVSINAATSGHKFTCVRW